MNQNIVSTLKKSQDLIKSTIVDIEHLEDLKLSNEDIKFNLEQADRIYKEVAENNEEESNLYRQLEKEMEEEKYMH